MDMKQVLVSVNNGLQRAQQDLTNDLKSKMGVSRHFITALLHARCAHLMSNFQSITPILSKLMPIRI